MAARKRFAKAQVCAAQWGVLARHPGCRCKIRLPVGRCACRQGVQVEGARFCPSPRPFWFSPLHPFVPGASTSTRLRRSQKSAVMCANKATGREASKSTRYARASKAAMALLGVCVQTLKLAGAGFAQAGGDSACHLSCVLV